MLPSSIRTDLINASKLESNKPAGASELRIRAIDSTTKLAMLEHPECFTGLALRDAFPDRFNRRGDEIETTSTDLFSGLKMFPDVERMFDDFFGVK